MPTLPDPTDLGAQIRAVRREVMRRRRDFPRLVEHGVLRRETAVFELAVMEAVLATLTAMQEADRGDVQLSSAARCASARAA